VRRGAPVAGALIAALLATAVTTSLTARGDGLLVPPWSDPRDVAMPTWARSVVPNRDDSGRAGDMRLFARPDHEGPPRGLTGAGVSLPIYGSKRGPGCSGRWWLVGPLAWTCSDDAELSPHPPNASASPAGNEGPVGKYYFVRSDGAGSYVSLESALEGGPDRDLEGGWGLAIAEERDAGGQRWGRTSHGMWIAMNDLAPAQVAPFHGETLADGHLDFAWVISERASVWPSASVKGKPAGSHDHFERVDVLERTGPAVRVGPGAWMRATDLAQPSLASPPAEIAGAPTPGAVTAAGVAARWIDVELATQTLVAYEGVQPVYATLVSTGRGPVGSGSETPTGVHRVWVKIAASDMANSDRGDLEAHYSLEDVPYVQFFNGSVALHGTYWHHDFGHIRSHGCVNLAIADARWLFAFTGPRLLDGWVAAYPTPVDDATIVRVR
jgi:lipoprotein-anchoring transpeptidase ErfK/SrfK